MLKEDDTGNKSNDTAGVAGGKEQDLIRRIYIIWFFFLWPLDLPHILNAVASYFESKKLQVVSSWERSAPQLYPEPKHPNMV